MARIEWVKQRLENWALWKQREAGGGLGFASSSILLAEPTANGYRESIIPIDDNDGALTDKAVHALQPARPSLYKTLTHIYINDLGVMGTARRAGVSASTIYGHLDAADHALSAWFGERAERQKINAARQFGEL